MYLEYDSDLKKLKDPVRRKNRELSFKKRTWRLLRLLEHAHSGSHAALSKLLSLAYGRTGALRHDLLAPFAEPSQSNRRIVNTLHRTRLPYYPPALIALLQSPFSSRTTTLQSLLYPPSLPARGIPGTEERVKFGGLTARRQTRPRWRFYRTRIGSSLLPPLEVRVRKRDGTVMRGEEAGKEWTRWGGRLPQLQANGLVDELERKAAGIGDSDSHTRGWKKPIHRRLGRTAIRTSRLVVVNRSRRYLRRRYRSLLNNIPILTVTPPDEEPPTKEMSEGKEVQKQIGKAHQHWRLKGLEKLDYKLSYSDLALGGKSGWRELDEEENWWIESEREKEKEKTKSKGRRK
ncbi:hypothetical protein BT69DRAFT_1285889 [Atractiella rhizophila]|nr:hypothetical protein BT69DRAFT_1285889 [Atractiella rhizophila]